MEESVSKLAESSSQISGGGDTWFWFVFQILVLSGIFYFIVFSANISDVSRNWDKYRCNPTIIPFADMYGHNSLENFNYCMRNIFKGELGSVTNPFSTILQGIIGTLMTFLQNINSFRLMFATLLTGISKLFQEFIDRFKLLFMQIRTTSVRIQFLLRRVFGTFTSIIYMANSAITGGLNFGDTVLFKFIDFICFAPETNVEILHKGSIPISKVELGDIFVKTGSKITAKYSFLGDGQSMVMLPQENSSTNIQVSTNHYVKNNQTGKWIEAKDHPNAIPIGDWQGGVDRPLICLDTDNHQIPIGDYIFSDFTETNETDSETMKLVENSLNGAKIKINPQHSWKYEPCFDELLQLINDKTADQVELGEFIENDHTIGKVERHIIEFVEIDGLKYSPSQLVWCDTMWKRAGELAPIQKVEKPIRLVNLFMSKSATITTKDAKVLRDSMEIYSNDLQEPTANLLLKK